MRDRKSGVEGDDTEWYANQLEMTELFDQSLPSYNGELESLAGLDDSQAVFNDLMNLDWAFTEETTNYLSHDLHPYPAKFIPQIPRALITKLSLRGEMVWDCFGGCGTTALEALLLGRRAFSTDVNPLGKTIGEAKTLTLTRDDDEALCDLIEQLISLSANPDRLAQELGRANSELVRFIPNIPNISDWFHANAITELAYLKWRIAELDHEKSRSLAIAALSKSVLKASYQDGETRYARRQKTIEHGDVIRTFATNLSTALKKVRRLSTVLQFREATFKTLDLRYADVKSTQDSGPNDLTENSVDLVVTSPPYPNATDYHLYHRFRIFWLGFDPRDLAHREIGSHLRHQKEATGFSSYLDEMTLCLERVKRVLRPGRYAVLVLGDGVFEGVNYETAQHVGQAAKQEGYEVVGIIDRALHGTKRSFISAARRLRTEHLLVLRKPSCATRFMLIKPPYKLWPYEENIRKREVEALLGASPVETQEGHLTVTADALSLDKLRKLTFTHAFCAAEISREPTWQAILENGDALARQSQRKDPKYVTHGIHAYKGKFYPQLAKSLFSLAGLRAGQRILDPFCGSGTVLLEAYLNGLEAFGTDINVLAVKVARVKTEILGLDSYLRDRFLTRFEDRLADMDTSERWLSEFSGNAIDELLSWFPRPVLAKLGCLSHAIGQVSEPRVRELLEVIVSSIVREISHQEPRDLRIRRRQEPITDAPVYELFRERLGEIR